MFRLFHRKPSPLATEVFDTVFDSPVGARNRLDPNGEHCNSLASQGFSFVEIGPITPEPQKEIVPNKGARAVSERLRRKKREGVFIAADIIKNPTTDIEAADHDYEYCFSQLYDYVDMFFINVADDKVPGARQLQDIEYLPEIVDKLINLRLYFNDYKPILIELSDDVSMMDVDDIIRYVRGSGLDGIVTRNINIVRHIHEATQGRLPIIAKADMQSPARALEFLDAGATMLECLHPAQGNAIKLLLKKRLKDNNK